MDTDRASQSVAAADGSRIRDGRPGPQRRPGWRDQAITAGLRVGGAGLLIAAAAIHLDLYVTGYRSIPVIGGLFLLQIIVGFLVGAVILVTGSRVAAAAGAVFALATLGGYLLSIWAELFGFKEIRTTAGIVAGVVEVAAFAALAALAVRPRPAGQPSRPRALLGPAAAWLDAGVTGAAAAISAVSVVALVLLGVAVAGGRPARGRAACGPRGHRGAEYHHDQRYDGADQRKGLHPVLVRPGYREPVGLQRGLRAVLAAGDRQADRRSRRHRQAGHDHPVGRFDTGDLRRASALHLYRRHRTGPGQRQQHQPERRRLARGHGVRLTEMTGAGGTDWALGIEARSRALLSATAAAAGTPSTSAPRTYGDVYGTLAPRPRGR